MAASVVSRVLGASRALSRAAGRLDFQAPVRHVYNPLDYAREPAEAYLRAYAATRKRVLIVGMNPGPWGMAQTGVPFGEVSIAAGWLGITGRVNRPEGGHPRVAIQGFECHRSEVSGRRLWGLLRERFGTADRLAADTLVANYCPLLFLDEAGRNLTPDKIAREDRAGLYAICDRFLLSLIQTLRPEWLVGVGRFVETRLLEAISALGAESPRIGAIPHPSPASPSANRDWAAQATRALQSLGIW